jgi:dihydrofolate reductase
LADKIYLTRIDAEIPGDTYFPELDTKVWHETSREDQQPDEKNKYKYSFINLEKR